jgi:hypothetical protein
MAWQRRMFDAGWAGINWPKEFGGRGASLMEQLVWYEEYARVEAPDVTTGFVGLKHAGPTLIACGTETQKAFHLPRILRGEVVWCQGFSEPGAGSDLAALQTKAVIDGDELVVTGQKIWTSFGQIAEYQELLVRTDPDAPKHKGITWVICPMGLPGMDVRPIKTLAGNQDFCEVFYDGVRIPLGNVVGAVNDGWRVAMATLSFERGTAFMSEQVRLARRVDALVETARKMPGPAGRHRRRRDRAPPRAGEGRGGGHARHDVPEPQPGGAHGHARTGGVHDPALLLGARAAHRRARPRRGGGRGHPRLRGGRQRAARVGRALPGGPLADDRRGHQGDPAQHHRRARPRLAALRKRETPWT